MSKTASESPTKARRLRIVRVALVLVLGLLLTGVLLTPYIARHARGAALLARLTASSESTVPEWARDLLANATEQDLRLSFADGTVRARRYTPAKGASGGVVLLHGAHPRGIDETRLRAFAAALAGAGLAVLTPELPELSRYRIEAATTGRIAAAAQLHATHLRVPAVGVIGISFAGGLALIAAAEQGQAGAIGFVVTVGAHHDLMRLARYYAGKAVQGPEGERATTLPHPYGARVLLREHLERFVPPEDVPGAERALDAYLRDKHSVARKLAEALTPAGQATMDVILNGESKALAEMLLASAQAAAPALAAASPRGQLQTMHVPVYLVHGEGDPIIPSIETRWLAREVPHESLRAVVITPLLRHAEFPTPPTLGEQWQLVSLMAKLLAEAETSAVSAR